MFCTKCGKEFDEKLDECPFCGEKNEFGTVNQEERKKKKDKMILSIIISIFVVAVVCLVIFLPKKESNKEQLNEDPSTIQEDTKNYSYYSIGEEFNFDGIDIKVKDISITRYTIGGAYYAGDGYKWLNLNLTLTNNTSNTKRLKETGLLSSNSVYVTAIKYINQNGDPVDYSRYLFYGERFFGDPESIIPYGNCSGICSYMVPDAVFEKLLNSSEDDEGLGRNVLYFEFRFNKRAEKDVARIKIGITKTGVDNYYVLL